MSFRRHTLLNRVRTSASESTSESYRYPSRSIIPYFLRVRTLAETGQSSVVELSASSWDRLLGEFALGRENDDRPSMDELDRRRRQRKLLLTLLHQLQADGRLRLVAHSPSAPTPRLTHPKRQPLPSEEQLPATAGSLSGGDRAVPGHPTALLQSLSPLLRRPSHPSTAMLRRPSLRFPVRCRSGELRDRRLDPSPRHHRTNTPRPPSNGGQAATGRVADHSRPQGRCIQSSLRLRALLRVRQQRNINVCDSQETCVGLGGILGFIIQPTNNGWGSRPVANEAHRMYRGLYKWQAERKELGVSSPANGRNCWGSTNPQRNLTRGRSRIEAEGR